VNLRSRAGWTGIVLVAALWTAASLSPASAQQAAGPKAGPTAGERYKNIQVLKDLPANQLHDAMTFMSATVGGNCLSCHVRGADGELAFDKDDNDHKVAARAMITMVRAINTQHFKGEDTVTCATCHQGRREPVPVPPLSQPLTPEQIAALAQRGAQRPAGTAPGAPPPPGGRGAQRPTETVDQVIDKYAAALGGRAAIANLTTRTRRGTLTNRAGQSAPVTIEETAAGLVRTTLDATPAFSRAFDGAAAWTESGGRVRELEGVEVANAALASDLALALQLKDTYTAMAVRAYDRVNGKAVIVVEGRRSPAASETLSFDRETGLLVRRSARLKTPLGLLPVQIDYDDYRPVDGVQTPFDVRVTDWESVSIQKFAEIAHNQRIDPGRFAKPAGK
jgi:hypothetical protein